MIDVACGAATHVGRVREQNEDSLIAEYPLFAIADGMGGRAAGEVASAIVIDTLRAVTACDPATVADVAYAISEANRAVAKQAATLDEQRGMLTTLVGLAAVEDDGEDRWLVFNVGDSRLYRLEGDSFIQLTRDHSEVQDLLESGAVSAEEAVNHPLRNAVTRAIGVPMDVEPDLWLLPVVAGERFLICSDGLSNEVSPGSMAEVLGEADPEQAVARLVAMALDGGGHDNISVVVVAVAPEWPVAASADPD